MVPQSIHVHCGLTPCYWALHLGVDLTPADGPALGGLDTVSGLNALLDE